MIGWTLTLIVSGAIVLLCLLIGIGALVHAMLSESGERE